MKKLASVAPTSREAGLLCSIIYLNGKIHGANIGSRIVSGDNESRHTKLLTLFPR